MRLLTLLLVCCALLFACSGVPAEATSQHKKALAALEAKDAAAFAALVVPSQRKGALGLPSTLGIQSDKKVSDLTLEDVLAISFFAEAKEVRVNTDLVTMDGADKARLGATFDFGESTFAIRQIVLVKEDGEWLVDLKATLEWWGEMDGAAAFSALVVK